MADIKKNHYLEIEGIPPINIIGEIPKDKIDYIIEECIEKQPKALLEKTKLIHLCTHSEFEAIKKKLGIVQAVAFATSMDNNIYVDTSIYELRRVITHELAHNYDFQNGYISEQSWFIAKYNQMIKDSKFDSLYGVIDVAYARSDMNEFFAEVSDAYFNETDYLKTNFPELYNLFDEIYTGEDRYESSNSKST